MKMNMENTFQLVTTNNTCTFSGKQRKFKLMLLFLDMPYTELKVPVSQKLLLQTPKLLLPTDRNMYPIYPTNVLPRSSEVIVWRNDVIYVIICMKYVIPRREEWPRLNSYVLRREERCFLETAMFLRDSSRIRPQPSGTDHICLEREVPFTGFQRGCDITWIQQPVPEVWGLHSVKGRIPNFPVLVLLSWDGGGAFSFLTCHTRGWMDIALVCCSLHVSMDVRH